MPTTYAHWRFGQKCLNKMPKKYKTIVNKHIDLYNFGVHGPDIFFYDLKNNEVNSYGYEMHCDPAKDFFERTRIIYKSHEEKEEMLAYILGFLNHYTLDSVCHGYVFNKTDKEGTSHNRIEAEFDKYLIIKDGKKPTLVNRGSSLKPSKKIAHIISYFHPFSEQMVYKELKSQKTIINFITCYTDIKRVLLRKICLKNNLTDYSDLIIYKKEAQDCYNSNLRLDKLSEVAIKKYSELMNELLDYIFKDVPLSDYYNNTYNGAIEYNDMPVLSFEKEKKYKL